MKYLGVKNKGMSIVANALQGNIPVIAWIRIENPDGTTYFEGREDAIWTNRGLLNAECTIHSGWNMFICRLKEWRHK